MRKTLIILLILVSTICSGQVIKFKLFLVGAKYPNIEIIENEPWITILDSNNEKCEYLLEDGEFTVFHNPEVEEIKLQINVSLRELKLKIKNFSQNDTIKLNPLFLVVEPIEMLDVWYKYDDFGYYKRQCREPKTEYNEDSTYYCIGKYKGKNYRSPEPYSFYFFENGKWKTYSKNGDLVAQIKYKNERPSGPYNLNLHEFGLKANGKFKNGKMIGAWEFNFDNKKYTYSIKDNYLIFDLLNCNLEN